MALKAHTGTVRCVNFSADGKLLITGSDDKTVKVGCLQQVSFVCVEWLVGQPMSLGCCIRCSPPDPYQHAAQCVHLACSWAALQVYLLRAACTAQLSCADQQQRPLSTAWTSMQLRISVGLSMDFMHCFIDHHCHQLSGIAASAVLVCS